jgi:hypothetical protein
MFFRIFSFSTILIAFHALVFIHNRRTFCVCFGFFGFVSILRNHLRKRWRKFVRILLFFLYGELLVCIGVGFVSVDDFSLLFFQKTFLNFSVNQKAKMFTRLK